MIAHRELQAQVAQWLCAQRNGENGWNYVPGRQYWLEDAAALLSGPLAAVLGRLAELEARVAR